MSARHLVADRGATCVLAAYIVCGGMPAVAADVKATQLPAVEVVGTTPLPGLGLPREEIAAPVQTATGAEIERSHAIDLSGYMTRFLGSVYVNEVQNNPFQPDVNYRGYTASPLLGTPQGLSVYMDGVRLNQPFGDVVSWDLIPRSAIASVALMPGSNPLFGLNTLGGALSIQTKDGYSNPGGAVQAIYGEHARRAVEFEHGGHQDNGVNWFVTGNLFKEDGWRDDSPSRVGQFFGKFGWRDAVSDVSLTAAYADSNLNGNGLQEQRFLARDYASVYTKPDTTVNRSVLLNLAARHSVSDDIFLAGNAYYRDINSSTFNGDINEESLGQNVYAAGENAANTPFPSQQCIDNVLANDEPAEKCNGLINRTQTDQQNYGVSGQVSWLADVAGRPNQFTAGAAYDASRSSFKQSTQLGYLNPDRGVTGLDAFGDGVTGGEVDGEPYDARVDLDGHTYTWSLYATDTLTLDRVWHLTLSGRYNKTTVRNRDHITPGGGAGSLDGDHDFDRFNPAFGLAFAPSPAFNAYLGYNEGSRAPSVIELGCADPNNPCKLPNAMAGDPPLKQVVARTWEAGLRGKTAGNISWSVGVFRAENTNDIMFVADEQAGFGYFKNFGKTRRQGLELGLNSRIGPATVGANYTFLDATYRSAELINGTGNSTNDMAQGGNPGFDGAIEIRPGDRIPLIPRQMFKAYADFEVSTQFSFDVDMLAIASSYARGNENNQHEADGTYYLGSGKIGGYAVFNLGANYRPTSQMTWFAQVNNLFDRQYYTAAQLGSTGFADNGNFIAQPFAAPVIDGERAVRQATFYAPGAPRMIWIGVRYEFDKPVGK